MLKQQKQNIELEKNRVLDLINELKLSESNQNTLKTDNELERKQMNLSYKQDLDILVQKLKDSESIIYAIISFLQICKNIT